MIIDPSACPAGSAVRTKKKRPKAKIVLKKKETKQKKKRYRETENSVARRESNPVYLHVQATP